MPRFVLLILSVLVFIADAAARDAWQDEDLAKVHQVEVLESSLKPVPGAPFHTHVTWGKVMGDRLEQAESIADCANFELRNLSGFSRRGESPDQSPIDHSGRPLILAYYGSIEAKVLDYACRRAHPSAFDDLHKPNPICTEAGYKELPSCRGDAELRVNVELFTRRSMELPQACGATSDDALAVQREFLVRADACPDMRCAAQTVGEGLHLVSRDLEQGRASRENGGQPATNCRAVRVVAEIAFMRQQQAVAEHAFRSYLDCAKKEISSLDDKTSTPEQVARKVHQACEAPFIAGIEALRGDPNSPSLLGEILSRLASEIVSQRGESPK